MTLFVNTILLAFVLATFASAETKAAEQNPLLGKQDVVYLSQFKREFHNIADIVEQCTYYLQRVNDKFNPPSQQQRDSSQLLRHIAQELRQRKWPYGNEKLADYFDLCLEKAPNAINVQVQQTSASGRTTITSKNSVSNANSKTRIVNGQLVEDSSNLGQPTSYAQSVPPAVATVTSVTTNTLPGNTGQLPDYGSPTTGQPGLYQPAPNSRAPEYQSPEESVYHDAKSSPGLGSTLSSAVHENTASSASSVYKKKLNPLDAQSGRYERPAPLPSYKSGQYQPQVTSQPSGLGSQAKPTIDTVGQLVSENEALKRRLAESAKLADDFRLLKEQTNKLSYTDSWDLRSFAADYLATKKQLDEMKPELAQLREKVASLKAKKNALKNGNSELSVSNADLLKCHEDLEDVQAVGANLKVELDGVRLQLDTCNNQLRGKQSVVCDNAKTKQELVKLENLVKQQQVDKAQCRKEQAATIQAKVQAELERSRCDNKLADLEAKLAALGHEDGDAVTDYAIDHELQRNHDYRDGHDDGADGDTIEVNYTGDTYTNDDVPNDDHLMTGPSRAKRNMLQRANGDRTGNRVPVVVNSRDENKQESKSNDYAAYEHSDGPTNIPVTSGPSSTSNFQVPVMSGSGWRGQQQADMERLQQARNAISQNFLKQKGRQPVRSAEAYAYLLS